MFYICCVQITGTLLQQPDQTIKEWKREDYLKNLQFIAGNYSKIVYEFALDGNNGPTVVPTTPVLWVKDYLENASYYFGRNANPAYSFIMKDEVNNRMPFPKYKGQDIYELIKHTVGVIGQFTGSLHKILSCVAISEGVISRKETLKNFAKFQIENKADIEEIQLFAGLKFEPINKMDFENTEQVDKYFETYQDAVEKIYLTLARYSFQFNHGKEKFEKQSEYFGIGGVIVMRIYAHAGKAKWKIIEPQNAIWDNYKTEGNQHRNDRFGGEYTQMTIPEILTNFKCTKEQRERLETMAKGNSQLWAAYNTATYGNIVWWQTSNSGVPVVTCVHGEWKSKKFEGTEMRAVVNENGEIEQQEIEIWTDVKREGWIVGNMDVFEYGESPNQLTAKSDPSQLRLSYIVASADTILGMSMGIAGRLKAYQNYKDFLKTYMTKLISHAKGKVFVMYSDGIPEGLRSSDMLAQLSQAGVVVVNREDQDDDMGNKVGDVVDLTLDPNILTIANLIAQERSYMDNIISLPANARGLQTEYQGKEVMQMNIQQSGFGMSSYYDTFYTWQLRVLEYSADLNKLIMPEGDEDTLTMLIGDAKVELVKQKDLKNAQFEDFALALGVEDFMTDADRQFWLNYYAQKAAASNDPEYDLIVERLMSVKSKTEFREELNSVISNLLQRRAQEQLTADNQQQTMADKNAQAQVQSTKIGVQGRLEEQKQDQDHDIAKMITEKTLDHTINSNQTKK